MTRKPNLELEGTVLRGEASTGPASGFVMGKDEAAANDRELRQMAGVIAGLRAEVDLWKKIAAAALGVAVLVGVVAIAWCVRLEGKTSELESGWSTRLITELMFPKSEEQLRASLATLSAQVETARANKVAPNAPRMRAFSLSVSKVIAQSPDFPEAWQAASQLVSYRRMGLPGQKICDGPAAITAGEGDKQQLVTLNFHDCEIVLDGFLEGEDASVLPPDAEAMLELKNVHVVYRGGSIAHIRNIVFSNCSFDFEMDKSPAPAGLLMTETLLSIEDIRSVTVKLKQPLG